MAKHRVQRKPPLPKQKGKKNLPEARIASLNPRFLTLCISLGLLEQGKYQEAVMQLSEALRLNPNFAEAHYNLRKAYLMVGNRGLALKEYEILKAMNPDLAERLERDK